MRLTTSETVRREILIKARRETVFRYFTDPALVTQWKGQLAVLEPEPGGIFRVARDDDHVILGEYVEVNPPERVVFTFGWEKGDIPLPPGSSTVEVTLTPHGDNGSETLLTLIHRDLPPEAAGRHAEGWDYTLPRLAQVASEAE